MREYKNKELRKEELHEQQSALALKRQEILFPLIKEFEEKKNLYYAKEIIDGISIEAEFKEGNKKIYTPDYLESLLKPVPETDDELFIRIIIDNFLNFFGKLGYLLDNKIILKKK